MMSAKMLHSAIRRNSDHWLALVSPRNKDAVDSYYKELTPAKMYRQLRRAMSKHNRKWNSGQASENAEKFVEVAQPERRQGFETDANGANGGNDKTSVASSLESPFKNWNGRAFAYPNNKEDLANQGGSSAWTLAPVLYPHQHQEASSTAGLPRTELQLGLGEPDRRDRTSMSQLVVPQSSNTGTSWLRLGSSNLVDSSTKESRPAGRTGIARWRRPPPSLEQSDSS